MGVSPSAAPEGRNARHVQAQRLAPSGQHDGTPVLKVRPLSGRTISLSPVTSARAVLAPATMLTQGASRHRAETALQSPRGHRAR